MPAGRPDEGRVRMNVHVLPATAKAIGRLLEKDDPAMNTQGKVIDSKFAAKCSPGKSKARKK